MKQKPTGWVAKCQCGSVVGAMDIERTEHRERGHILGEWLMDGCTIEPRFAGSWSVQLSPCQCAKTTHP